MRARVGQKNKITRRWTKRGTRPSAHAALLVDQAGWRLSGRLTVPPNITLIPLPAKCP
jgi:hypothetical protein